MNIKLRLTSLIFLLCLTASSHNNSKTLSPEKIEIENLKAKLDDLERKLEYQSNQINSQAGMLDTAFDGVSTELGASSNSISMFSIIIAILSIGLGLYITKIEKSIKTMVEDSETLMQKNIEIKKNVEALSDKITKDSGGLYKIIRNEESNHLLDRLISVPEDILNLFYSIASRDLEEQHFFKLKEAYLQIKDDDAYSEDYLTLLFQHFTGLSLLDEDIRLEFLNNIKVSLKNSFKSDIVKSSKDFFDTIVEQEIDNYKSEINKFVEGICESTFSDREEIYFQINNSVNSRELKFNIYKNIDVKPETLIFRKKFGQLILDYDYIDLTPDEEIIVEKIKNLI
nr:hypothetical protein [uncultured Flavobacterium sp.]